MFKPTKTSYITVRKEKGGSVEFDTPIKDIGEAILEDLEDTIEGDVNDNVINKNTLLVVAAQDAKYIAFDTTTLEKNSARMIFVLSDGDHILTDGADEEEAELCDLSEGLNLVLLWKDDDGDVSAETM